MLNTSVIELSKSALQNNIEFLRNYLQPGVRISSVIKGNAYGHQIESFVPLAEECGIDHFSVFNAYEAYRAHNSMRKGSTIMIMGMIENSELEWAIRHGVEFWVFEIDRLSAAISAAKRSGIKARIHIEFETGMNRTGFGSSEMSSLIRLLKKERDALDIRGFCTHFAGAESIANHYRIQNQIRRFKAACRAFEKAGVKAASRHAACSAAAFAYPATQYDMVRIGIMQYGFWSSKEILITYLNQKKEKTDPLRRLLRWRSKVMSTKSVATGEFIGYGTNYLAQQDMRIATVPVGYSHGYSRSLSFQGRVIVRGQRVDVVGIVNMNLLIINVSDVDGVEKGDEVVLIGKQGDSEITVASFSEFSNQLNYELLTRLPQGIPRIIDVT